MKITLFRSLVLSLLLFASACAPTFIPNTDVEDTTQNRKIIIFCETYRHAVEDKATADLLKMAHPRYHEDGGNTNAEDDMDYDGLREYLTTTFMKTQGIRYEIRYRKITITETNHIHVDYTYAASYKIPGVKGDEWRHTVADNRLDIVTDGEGFKIMAGM